MKFIFLAGMLCLSGLLLSQCSKEKDEPASTILTARAEHNSTNLGLYKGVFVGSTGIIVVSLRNENSNVLATIRINGTLHQFTATGNLEANKPTTLHFQGVNSAFTFEVDADGGSPRVTTLSVDGHPDARVILFKEKSNEIVSCYEGSYTGSQQGTWNVIIRNGQLLGLVKSGSISAVATGTVDADNTTTGEVSSGAVFTGKFVKNNVAGTWENNSGNVPESGTWEGVRTY